MTMNLNSIPKPVFKHNVKQLVNYYKKAALEIIEELKRNDITLAETAHSKAVLIEIGNTLIELDKKTEEWVKKHIPEAAKQGVARSLLSLGLAKTLKEAEKIAGFNGLNLKMIDAAVSDTYSDLLAVTENMNRKIKSTIRKAIAESLKLNYAQGIMGIQTNKTEMLNRLYSELGEAVDYGIIDAAGRRWRAETYVEMVAHEKMNQAYFEANINESISRGAFYGIISSHGATDACRYHEGRIVKLIEDAPGNYPTIDELKATNQVFHVRCKHHVNTLRDVDLLPDSVLEKAEKQAELGNKAIKAGGRNPEID